jgi:hypothetical protein
MGIRSRGTLRARLCTCAVALVAAARLAGDNGTIDAESFIRHVKFLASDENGLPITSRTGSVKPAWSRPG